MNRIFSTIAFAATTLMFFSCSDADVNETAPQTSNGTTINATQEQLTENGEPIVSTRSHLIPVPKYGFNLVAWDKGDSINLSDGTKNVKFTVKSVGNNPANCTFYGQNGVSSNAKQYVAIYPYDIKHQFEGSKVKNVTLPSAQNAVAGSYDPTCNLMVAKTGSMSGSMIFYHVCSYIKVKPTFDCVRVVFKAKGANDKLAGTFDVNVDDKNTSVENVTNESKSVTLVGDIKKDSVYFIMVLPGTYKDGIEVDFEQKPSKDMINVEDSTITTYAYKFTGSATLNAKRSDITSFEGITPKKDDSTEHTTKFVYLGSDLQSKLSENSGDIVLWAKYNLGAKSETEAGDYYAWGEVKPKSDYTADNYLCANYYPNKLDQAHDAAAVNLGRGWRMPTRDDFKALKENNIFVCGNNGFYVYAGTNSVKNIQKMQNGSVHKYETGYKPKDDGASKAEKDYVNKLTSKQNHLFIPFGGTKLNGNIHEGSTSTRCWMNDHGNGDLMSNYGTLTAYYWGINTNQFNAWSQYMPAYSGMNIRPVFEVKW